jgi:hypothetical protein
MFIMTSTSATQLITTISCDEDDIDFMFQSKIGLGSQEASNVDIDATWEILIPKLVANKKLWSPSHRTSTYWVFFVMNDGAIVNICNPQMMHCFLCHPTQLELLDAEGKHKGLVSYNKNHGTSILKKHACHEHPNLYKKWSLFLL